MNSSGYSRALIVGLAGLLALSSLATLGLTWLLLSGPAPAPVSLSATPAPTFTATWTLSPSPTPSPTASFTPSPSPTLTATPTATPTVTETYTPAPTETPTLTPSATPPPAEARVANLAGYDQALPLSCEARSAADWAAYFGATFTELDFLAALPRSDNPLNGFVGEPSDPPGQLPPASYGVYAGPVANTLQAFGVSAEALGEAAWETVQSEIAAGRPVIAWVVGSAEPGAPETYTLPDGSTVPVARYEHTVLVYGYAPGSVFILDGSHALEISHDRFIQSWSVLGRQIVRRPPQ